jgi:hypothetical protein
MSLPLIGFIMTIVWASGGTANLNRRNLARGYLLIMGLGILLSIIMALALASSGISLNQLYQLNNLIY